VFNAYVSEPLLGCKRIAACRKLCAGVAGVASAGEARNLQILRARYDRHHDAVRAAAAPERILEVELGEGWGRLCAFLGKDVPDAPFPNVNSRAQLEVGSAAGNRMVAMEALVGVVLPWAAAAGALAFGVWMTRERDLLGVFLGEAFVRR
jgi:sulfotransferase family protein